MSEQRFKKMDTIIDPFPIWDTVEEKGYNCTDTLDVLVDLLNEQQATINILLEELVNAQQQGYVVGFLHKNEHCSLMPKELDDE